MAETLERLRNDSSITIRVQDGWTIASSDSLRTVWSFTPPDHPAHPSYVERTVVERNGSLLMRTNAKCGAEKSACDQLVQDFIELNDRVREMVTDE